MKIDSSLLFLILIVLLYQSINAQTHNSVVDLSNERWIFYQENGPDTLTAKVPGTVHTDLLDNNKIPEFYFRDNENSLQWIGEKNWIYETSFNVPAEIFKKENIELLFQGLDTHAKVYLNDKLILTADNFFRSWEVNVKNYLKEKNNTLKVFFLSPVKYNKTRLDNEAIKLADDYVYTRKPAYHFGWDWGPVFITIGIWKPVLLNGWDDVKIKDVQIYQKELNKTSAHLEIICELEADKSTSIELTTNCATLNQTVVQKFNIKKGINKLPVIFKIENPKLWWPNGLGEAFLYNFSTSVKSNNILLDTKETNFGIRTVKLIQKPDSLGKSFCFEINGTPVFMKGANYIPQDMFLTRPTTKDYENTIKQVTAVNMNMLRVWGGGFYENDIFYDLCDKNGILIWQDFMFACAMYPGDQQFLDNFKQEAIENILRLRNHPSIALWCGNNENYIGWKDWRWPKRFSKEDSAKVWNDYEKVFHQLLPSIISEYDSDRFYWPSSPKHGWGYPVNSDGDVHYWGIWHAQEPFEEFAKTVNIGRFMSEYGFQGCPEFNSVKKFTNETDWNINSAVMKIHQKHRIGYPVIDKYFNWYYKTPKDFQSYLYVSQLMQAMGIGLAIETHRAAMPHCMGTLYWQINDLYPVTSWASIDYYGTWKALHYRLKELYGKIIIVPQIEEECLNIKIVSDELEQKKGLLNIELKDFDGNVLYFKNVNAEIKSNTSSLIFSSKVDEILNDRDKSKIFLDCTLSIEGGMRCHKLFYFAFPKEQQLPDPEIIYSLQKINEGYQINLESKKLARGVFISFEGIDGTYSDNYFDLPPNQKYSVVFTPKNNVDLTKAQMKVISLFNSYQ